MDLSAFSTPVAYTAPSLPTCVRGSSPPSAWRDTVAGRWLMTELVSRRIDLDWFFVKRQGARLFVGERMITLDVDAPVSEQHRPKIIESMAIQVAATCRLRMLLAVGWTPDQKMPPWAQTTTLLLERMLAPQYRPLDLQSCIQAIEGDGVRVWHEPFSAYHGDVRDKLIPGFQYRTNDNWLRLYTEHGDHRVDINQIGGTDVTLWFRTLPETVIHAIGGRPLGDLVELGPLLAPWFAHWPIIGAIQTDYYVELRLDVPVRTLAPAPRAALAALEFADHPQAHEPWPWWLLPTTC